MQKECKDRKGRELIELSRTSMIRSESKVPDSEKTLLNTGISGSGFEPGFAMIEMIVAELLPEINSLSLADKVPLMEVEGVGQKRAKSILEVIQLMRNRSVYR